MFSRAVNSISKPAPSSIKGAMFPFALQVPLEGSNTPAIIFNKVDFPDPLVPNIPNTSPFLISSEISSRALNSLKRSSCLAKAIIYSLRLLSCSFAMLKIMETWSIFTIVSLSESSKS